MPSIAKPHAGTPMAIRVRRKLRKPAPGHSANRSPQLVAPATDSLTDEITIRLLQEVVAALRGRAAVYEHHPIAAGDSGAPLGTEKLRQLAEVDLTHSRCLAERIVELGGAMERGSRHQEPCAEQDANTLPQADTSLADAVVDSCGRLLKQVGESDLTTKFLIDDILFDELEHFQDRRMAHRMTGIALLPRTPDAEQRWPR